MSIIISETEFDPWQQLQDYQQQATAIHGKFGATAIFVGTMRDFNDGDEVVAMYLEHYPKMTEKQLALIIDEAQQQWQLLDCLLVHRVGDIHPNDAIVLVAVWSSHRGDAFDASRYIMETLKSKAPFWKKEYLTSQQTRWVEKNTNGYQKS